MPIVSPNLDDRTFRQLMEEVRNRAAAVCPTWTDMSPGDPGTVLLELFAYLTEIMLYRLNRIPVKAYAEFLRLIGVTMFPPSAATVNLVFRRTSAGGARIEIPRNTRVSVGRPSSGTAAPVFYTSRAVTLEAGHQQVEVLAQNSEPVEGELAGKGTGLPGLWVTAARPPIVAPATDEPGLVVGVEEAGAELDDRAPAVSFGGKAYRIWNEVEHFTNLTGDRRVYTVDRVSGTITFASAIFGESPSGGLAATAELLAEVPAKDREIRLWYRTQGGPSGNVAANTLTVLKTPVAGVEVNNPAPATGGRPAETLENALARGPLNLHAPQRAVTASDYEGVALRSSGAIARARAFTTAALWVHAAPGTVEVLLVPYIPENVRPDDRISAATLQEYATETARSQVQSALDARLPLATACRVGWARMKSVKVTGRVVARREEDLPSLRGRVLRRLYQTISPLPSAVHPTGWRFGQALRAFHVYDIVMPEAGVSYLDHVTLQVEDVPEKDVTSLAADLFQPSTWYAGSGSTLYRTLDDGDGWEPAKKFGDESVRCVRVHRRIPGLVAVSTKLTSGASRIYISRDCGESWAVAAETSFEVEALAWTIRDGAPLLFLATVVGLYQLSLDADAVPLQILLDSGPADRGLYAVAALTDVRGQVTVAVAAQRTGGVFISTQGGKSGTFQDVGLHGEDVRVLAVQYDGPRSFLWAGVSVSGAETGTGCYRAELMESRLSPEGWKPFAKGWKGGSCRAIAFQEQRVLAASFQAGVLWLDSGKADPSWEAPEINCRLPQRELGRVFQRVDALATDPAGKRLMAGGPVGVYRSGDGGVFYDCCSCSEFTSKVTLPDTWLFCSGEHEIEVVGEDETKRD